jgi:P27 family predicted phage terminase small subunit
MPPGRPRKPSALRALEGWRGRYRPQTEDPAAPVGDPQRSDGLSKRQLELYERFAADLARLGVLQVVDGEMIRELAIHAAMVEEARKTIEKEGVIVKNRWGGPTAHPAVAVMAKSTHVVMNILAQCGLTPAARAKLSASEDKPETDTDVPARFRDAGA